MIPVAEQHQIRTALAKLSADAFERLCCDLLPREYPEYSGIESSLNALGKTTKGTPDAHVRLADGTIAAFQFTSQQSGVQAKVLSDISKIAGPGCHFASEVSEVLVCLTTPLQSEIALYEQQAQKHGWRIRVLSLDALTRFTAKHPDLCLEYLRLVISFRSSAEEAKQYDCGDRVLEAREGAKLSTSRTIELADLPSERLLKAIEAGEAECPLQYAERIAQVTSVSLQWLLHGEGPKYASPRLSLDDGPAQLRELDPARIYFCLETQHFTFAVVVEQASGAWITLEAGFTLDLFDWMGDYAYFPRILAYFNQVHREFGWRVVGRILPESSIRELIDGVHHPQQVIGSAPPYGGHWADDLRDVRRQYPIAENYGRQYGEWFIKLQDALASVQSDT